MVGTGAGGDRTAQGRGRTRAGHRRAGPDGGGQAGEADGARQHEQCYTAHSKAGQGRASAGSSAGQVCVRANPFGVGSLPN